jgi:hypothetical protein
MRKELERSGSQSAPHQPSFSNATSQNEERRVSLRYALHARVVFAWDDGTGQRRESRGHTRDVGQRGAFIIAPEGPARDACVSLSIFLPVMGAEARVVRLEVEGRVLRSGNGLASSHGSSAPALVGFAVSHQRVNLFSS